MGQQGDGEAAWVGLALPGQSHLPWPRPALPSRLPLPQPLH